MPSPGRSSTGSDAPAPLVEIECALPALSGMAVDFHEGGTGLAQSKIDNFRVEVCASSA